MLIIEAFQDSILLVLIVNIIATSELYVLSFSMLPCIPGIPGGPGWGLPGSPLSPFGPLFPWEGKEINNEDIYTPPNHIKL